MARKLISAVASYFGTSESIAKYRLSELGYDEVNGISCYIDGEKIPDHSCSVFWPDGITYTLSAMDAAETFRHDKLFREKLLTGKYIYVEGHICLNSPEYTVDNHLTDYARENIDECCLPFRVRVYNQPYVYHNGFAERGKRQPEKNKYKINYHFDAEEGTSEYLRENDAFIKDSMLWHDLKTNMPQNFAEAVNMILKAKGLTQEYVSLQLGIDRAQLIRNMRAKNVEISFVVAICVLLKIRLDVALMLIDITRNRDDGSQLYELYISMLLQADKISLKRCNVMLKESGLPPLIKNEYIA